MRAVRAFDSRFLTDTSNPLVGAGESVTRLSGFPALEPPRINIVPPAEKETKQPDLGVGGRMLMNGTRFENHRRYCANITLTWMAAAILQLQKAKHAVRS